MDSAATVNVIGCIYNNPSLIDNENYNFAEYDFPEDFHRIVFGAIYNLYQTGVKQITISAVEDYLSQRPKKLAVYKANKGDEYLEQVSAAVELSTFDYYYKRLKKMTLFREYQAIGMDLKWLYDNDNILDPKKKQTQEDFIDNHSLEELADIIDNKISEVNVVLIISTRRFPQVRIFLISSKNIKRYLDMVLACLVNILTLLQKVLN